MEYVKALIKDLRSLEAMRLSIDNIPLQIEMLEKQVISLQSSRADKVIVSGGHTDREQAIVNNIDEREQLALRLDMNRRRVDALDNAINALTRAERLIMDKCFIHGERNAIYKLSCELGYERAQIYRIRKTALKKLLMMLYGI